MSSSSRPDLIIRIADDDDFRRFFRREPPKLWTAMCGVRDNRIVGIGGIVYDDWGNAVGFLNSHERPAVSLHRYALKFMKAMRASGEPHIRTFCQGGLEAAERWLTRLGFKRTDEIVDTFPVWEWRP